MAAQSPVAGVLDFLAKKRTAARSKLDRPLVNKVADNVCQNCCNKFGSAEYTHDHGKYRYYNRELMPNNRVPELRKEEN